MALNTALLVAASLSGLSATAQDPRFDLQFAAPQSNQQEPAVTTSDYIDLVPAIFTVAPDQSQRVTVSFHQAPVNEVITWLESKGVSFVISEDDIANREVTINVLDEPISSVVNAIGLALGGTFEKDGNVYVFKRQNVYTFGNSPLQGSRGVATAKAREAYRTAVQAAPKPGTPSVVFGAPNAEGFRWVTPQGQKLDRKQVEELNRALEALRNMPRIDAETWEKDAKLRQELMRALEQAMQSARGGMYFFRGEMPGLQGLEKMELKGLDKEHREAMAKAHEEMMRSLKEIEIVTPKIDMKSMEKMRDHMKQLEKEGKLRTFTPDQMEKMHAEGLAKVFSKEDIEKLRAEGKAKIFSKEEMEKLRAEGKLRTFSGAEFPALAIGPSNLQGFVKSLTPQQRDLHKKQGYLKLSDLNAAQRRMLGIAGEGNFELRYKTDKDEVVVKSK